MQKAAASSAGDLEEVAGPSQSRHLASGDAAAAAAVAVAVAEGVDKNVGAVAGVGDDVAAVDQEAAVVREGVAAAAVVAAANLRRHT